MSITMNQALCKGCKACEQVCPGSLIKMNEAGKAYIKYPKDCWGWQIHRQDGETEQIVLNTKESNKY